MKGSLLFLALLGCLNILAQQKGSVKGKLVDTTSKQSLSSATVSALLVKDSSLAGFSLSDKKGFFEIKDLDTGQYLLMVSYSGYQNIAKPFSLTADKKDAEFTELILNKEYTTLQGVTVTDVAPIKINNDTVSFRADAFKTKPNATAEDLLKKLPGIQVQKDGTISAMGENVQKVYVDGKEFFGTDPKLATKNITADMVDQVQVFDDMSEQAKFSKIDDGSRSKTINIKLKKDKNKGQFGKMMVAAGTDKRYEGNLSYNRFRGNQRISLLGAANNTNKQGFSFSDIISSMGGMGQFSRGGGGGGGGMGAMAIPMGAMGGLGFGSFGSGITTSRSAGINYNDQWGKMDFRSSYFYSNTDNLLRQNSFRQTFFPNDSTTEATTESVSRNKNRSHRFNARWEYAVDSLNSFLYTANLNLQRSNGIYNDTSYTFSDALNDYLAITSSNNNDNERDGMNYSGELLYRRKLGKPGRTFTAGWRNSFNESESESFNRSPFVFYKPDGGIFTTRNQDFVTGQATRSNSNNLNASYTEPVGKNRIIEINYAYSHLKNTSDKRTYDFNSGTGKYDKLNAPLTNYFENTNISNRIGGNFREQQKKYNYQLGAAVQLTQLSSHSIQASNGKDTVIKQRFTNFFPNASFNLTVSRTKNLRINYRGRTNAPSITQLQDVPDVSNPLQVRTGNPSLEQEFNHNFNLNYSTFNILSFRFFAANMGFSTTANKIVNSIDSLNKAVTITRPVNMNGTYSGNAFISIGFPIKKLKGSNLNFSTIGVYNRDVSVLYKQANYTTRLLLTESFSINYNHKEKLDLGLNGSLTYNNARYSLQSALNNHYFTQTYSADISYTFKNDLTISTDIDYYINTGRTDGYNQKIPMWNGYIAKQFLKNKSGELRLSVFDILNQNKSVNRTVADNYLEDTRTNVLRQYFLLSFTYTLRRMGGPQIPPQMQKLMERGARQFGIH